MSNWKLYHGTNALFDRASLEKSRDCRDFGKGFYTTTIQKQAEQWASTIYKRYGGAGCFVYEFDFDFSEDLNCKIFDGLSHEWLHLIKENRKKGGLQHNFDLVKGPVANDNTMVVISLFIDGIYSEDAAIRELAFFKANDQVSLHTERALARLKLIRRYSL
jgi:hypothetical protein